MRQYKQHISYDSPCVVSHSNVVGILVNTKHYNCATCYHLWQVQAKSCFSLVGKAQVGQHWWSPLWETPARMCLLVEEEWRLFQGTLSLVHRSVAPRLLQQVLWLCW